MLRTNLSINQLAKNHFAITGKKTVNTCDLSHETRQLVYINLFKELEKDNYSIACENMSAYIDKSSQILAQKIIYSMYTTMYKIIDRELSTGEKIIYKWLPGINYNSCEKIVNSGYTDSMYFEIVGEIALYMCENMDRITRDKMVIDWHVTDSTNTCFDTCFTIGYSYYLKRDFFLDIYKVVRKYLYNNMQKQSDKECSVMMVETGDSDTPYYEVIKAVNSKDYINYMYNEFDNSYMSFDGENHYFQWCEMQEIEKILDNVTVYVWYGMNEDDRKKYNFDTLKTVLYELAKGTNLKDITSVSRNTAGKYKKAIMTAFNKDSFIKFYRYSIEQIEKVSYFENDKNINHYGTLYIDNMRDIYSSFDGENHILKKGFLHEYIPFTDNNYCKNATIENSVDVLAKKARGNKAICEDKNAYMLALVNMIDNNINNGCGCDIDYTRYVAK